ncbi:hypothetical protein P4I52_20505, partial [Escherichia coli]
QGKISSDDCLKKEQMVVSAIASTPQLFVPYLLAVRKTEEWMISQMSFSEAILCFFCTSMFLYMKRLYFEGVFLILYNSGLMTIFTSLPL